MLLDGIWEADTKVARKMLSPLKGGYTKQAVM